MNDRLPVQPPLLSDEASAGALVRVGVAGAQKTLSKAQRAFNRWTARIEAQRQDLEAWRGFADRLAARVARDLDPLRRRVLALRIAVLRRFDDAHDSGLLGKRERSRIAQVIVDEALAMLADDDDPALVALHDKYGDRPHAELRRREAAALRAMAEDALGTSFDGELDSPDAVLQAARAWVASAGDDDYDYGGGGGGEPPAARARARATREQALADGATRSVRELYRKLASALHPDREPDPVERDRKTALMQRLNQAHEARDLLQLLTLQIEVAQLDGAGLAGLDDARLAHYNRVLKEQSERLDDEIAALTRPFTMSLPIRRDRPPSPAAVLDALQQDIAILRRDCQRLAEEVAMFGDPLTVKAWLRTVRISKASRIREEDDPADLLAALMTGADGGAGEGGSGSPAPHRRRRPR